MNKYQFMNILESSLAKLPADEREVILRDFDDHFSFAMEEGKKEEEIAKSLGAPQQIAKELLATYRLEQVEQNGSASNIFRAVWAVIGLGFFNLFIVLAPFLTLVSILIAGWIVGISFIGSPLLVLIDTIITPANFVLFDVFMSIFLAGLGLFIMIGMYYVTKYLMRIFVRYLNFNVKVVKGGQSNG